MKKSISKEIILVMIFPAVFAFTLFFFAPSLIYIQNNQEFWFTPNLIYPYIGICTLAVFLILFLATFIVRKISKKVYRVINVILAFLSIGIYIQGNIVPNTNGPLDGHEIDWSHVNADMIGSYILWIIIILLIIVTIRKELKKEVSEQRKLVISQGALFALEIIVSVVALISNGGYDTNKAYLATADAEFEYSKNTNMVILLLDRLDSGYLVEDAKNGLFDDLEGFTFYYNTMGLFGRTAKAYPQILTGEKYFYQTSYDEYLVDAYDKSPLLNRLREENWSTDVYFFGSVEIPQEGQNAEYIENFKDVQLGINSRKRFITNIYRMVGYQYAPYPLKKEFWFYADEMLEDRKFKDTSKMFSWGNAEFYNLLDEEVEVSREENVFKYYHLEGLHTSYLNAECEKTEESQPIAEILKGNVKLIHKYIRAMKDAGIYDNAIIIIMGDHGNADDGENFWGTNPCLMIKGLGERQKFAMSNKPVSYEDLQDIYQNLLNGKSAAESTGFVPESPRERYFYRIDSKEWDSILIECRGTGPAADYELLEETGTRYYAE